MKDAPEAIFPQVRLETLCRAPEFSSVHHWRFPVEVWLRHYLVIAEAVRIWDALLGLGCRFRHRGDSNRQRGCTRSPSP